MKKIILSVAILTAFSACSTVQETADIENKYSNCIPNQASKLVGKQDLTNTEIEKITQASVVRKVSPNQAVTMDYRIERVTVVVDPSSKKIIRASCG